MRALKALVVVMGILLLGGTVALALVMVSRLANRDHGIASDAHPAHASLTIPQDARIDGIAGLGDRLALHLVSPAGDSILIVNPSSGATISTLEIKR
jgi:hypothetical protein